MTNTPQPRDERIEGAACNFVDGKYSVSIGLNTIDQDPFEDNAEFIARVAATCHAGGKAEGEPPGGDGAAGLLQKLTAAGDLLESASDQSEAWVIFSSAKSAARNHLATQPDTPAEEACPTCGGKGVFQGMRGPEPYIDICDTCHGIGTRPSDGEGPYKKGDTHEDVGIPMRGLWDGRNPDPLSGWELELVNAAYAAGAAAERESRSDCGEVDGPRKIGFNATFMPDGETWNPQAKGSYWSITYDDCRGGLAAPDLGTKELAEAVAVMAGEIANAAAAAERERINGAAERLHNFCTNHRKRDDRWNLWWGADDEAEEWEHYGVYPDFCTALTNATLPEGGPKDA